MDSLATVTAAELDDLRHDGGLPVLVDFSADWCGPCHALAPALAQVADELSGRLRVVKVDVDANPDAAASYAVTGVPTLVLLRAGEQVWSSVGVKPKHLLVRVVAAQL
jgi:thioredoxin 1